MAKGVRHLGLPRKESVFGPDPAIPSLPDHRAFVLYDLKCLSKYKHMLRLTSSQRADIDGATKEGSRHEAPRLDQLYWLACALEADTNEVCAFPASDKKIRPTSRFRWVSQYGLFSGGKHETSGFESDSVRFEKRMVVMAMILYDYQTYVLDAFSINIAETTQEKRKAAIRHTVIAVLRLEALLRDESLQLIATEDSDTCWLIQSKSISSLIAFMRAHVTFFFSYWRSMDNRDGITSHPIDDELSIGVFDASATPDYIDDTYDTIGYYVVRLAMVYSELRILDAMDDRDSEDRQTPTTEFGGFRPFAVYVANFRSYIVRRYHLLRAIQLEKAYRVLGTTPPDALDYPAFYSKYHIGLTEDDALPGQLLHAIKEHLNCAQEGIEKRPVPARTKLDQILVALRGRLEDLSRGVTPSASKPRWCRSVFIDDDLDTVHRVAGKPAGSQLNDLRAGAHKTGAHQPDNGQMWDIEVDYKFTFTI